jgi:hypothetical protein
MFAKAHRGPREPCVRMQGQERLRIFNILAASFAVVVTVICFCSGSPVVAALCIIALSYWHALAWSSFSRRLQKKSFLAFTFSHQLHRPALALPRTNPTAASILSLLPRHPSPPPPLHPLHPRAANGTKWHRTGSPQQAQATSHIAYHRPPHEADQARDRHTHA